MRITTDTTGETITNDIIITAGGGGRPFVRSGDTIIITDEKNRQGGGRATVTWIDDDKIGTKFAVERDGRNRAERRRAKAVQAGNFSKRDCGIRGLRH